MKVIVDAFGGDNAPLEVIKGCARAVSELGVNVVLTGSRNKIEKCAAENGISLSGIEMHRTSRSSMKAALRSSTQMMFLIYMKSRRR